MYRRHSATKRKRKLIKALAVTRRVLLFLAEGAKDAFTGDEGPWYLDYHHIYDSRLTLEDRFYIKQAQARRALYELKRRNFVEIRKQGGKIAFQLTEKGKMAAIKDQIRLADERRDGKAIIVSFDIPEQEKCVRSRLRYHLKDFGFERLQDSVWASERDIATLIARLVSDIGVNKWVRVFEAEEITVKKISSNEKKMHTAVKREKRKN
jgi:CRISPR-associated endonuclease Cas2